MNNCENCAKQYMCKITGQEQCKPIKWHETKNYGEVTYVYANDTEERK